MNCCIDKTVLHIQSVPGRKINILGGHSRDDLLDHIMDAIACIKERQDKLRRATCHVLTRVAKCIDVDGGIFENLL
jgi:hypothetical protein